MSKNSSRLLNNVQELIEALQKVEDKTLPVCIVDRGYRIAIFIEEVTHNGKEMLLIDRFVQ